MDRKICDLPLIIFDNASDKIWDDMERGLKVQLEKINVIIFTKNITLVG